MMGIHVVKKVSTLIEDDEIGILPSKLLPDSGRLGKFPLVLFGFDPFALRPFLLNPYPSQGLMPEASLQLQV